MGDHVLTCRISSKKDEAGAVYRNLLEISRFRDLGRVGVSVVTSTPMTIAMTVSMFIIKADKQFSAVGEGGGPGEGPTLIEFCHLSKYTVL